MVIMAQPWIISFGHTVPITMILKSVICKQPIYRKSSIKGDMAEKTAKEVALDNLLDFRSRNELYLLNMQKGNQAEADRVLQEMKAKMRGDHEEYLELAVNYGNSGMYDEAIDVLSRIDGTKNNPDASQYPMVYYYLGYYWNRKGDAAKAKQYYDWGASRPWLYCFPFRDESIAVFEGCTERKTPMMRWLVII